MTEDKDIPGNGIERGVGLYRFDKGNVVILFDKNSKEFYSAFKNKSATVEDLKDLKICLDRLLNYIDNEK